MTCTRMRQHPTLDEVEELLNHKGYDHNRNALPEFRCELIADYIDTELEELK